MQALIVSRKRCIAERDSPAGKRLALGRAQWRRVMEVDAVQPEFPERRMAREFLDKARD